MNNATDLDQQDELTNIPCKKWAKQLLSETQSAISQRLGVHPTWNETIRILCESYKTNEPSKAA